MTFPSAAQPSQPRPPGPDPARPASAGRRAAGRRRGRAVVDTVCTVGVVCAGLAVLTGCDKPTPLATLTSGEDTVHTEARCYDDGEEIPTAELKTCLQDTENATTLKVDPDAIVRFGVDPEIADQGWAVLLNGRPLSDVSHKTYRTIPGSVFFDPEYGGTGSRAAVSVLEGHGSVATGLWSFTLTRKT